MNKSPHISATVAAILSIAVLLSNCGSMEMFFINPGSFDYLSCADIAQKASTAREREQELKTLMDRAEQGMFGTLVATTTYRPEYLKTQGDLKLLEETARRKSCAGPTEPPGIPGQPAGSPPR